jgi:Uncharacterised protein family (UPF0158)
MSKQSILDPAEARFRDLRAAIYGGDGRGAPAAIESRSDLETLQYVGDGLLMAVSQGIPGVETRAAEHVAALRRRDLEGDEDLALELEAALGLTQAPALRDLPVDLDELSLALEGDPLLTGGRLDLRTGEVHQFGPLYESDYLDESDESDDEKDGWLNGPDDGEEERWLNFDSLGSRAGFRDMEEFLETVADQRLAARLDRALGGRGAFRRFKDELADAPDELVRFFRFTDDRRRGRARQWLAESGLRPTVPVAPAAPNGPDLDRRP